MQKWLEAENIAPTDVLYFTLEILNILAWSAYFFSSVHMSCQDLWGVFGSELTLFTVCATHFYTDSNLNLPY